MMEIESILRQSNPMTGEAIPTPDSPEGASIKARVLEGRSQPSERSSGKHPDRRFTMPVAALVAVAAAVVLLITLLPSALGTQSSTAAAALNKLASTAGSQPALGPGQYAYTEVEQQPTGLSGSGATPTANSWTQYSVGTVQTWIADDGAGRQVTTTDLNPQFPTAADKSAWVRSGGTYEEPPKYVVTDQQFGSGGKGLSGNQMAGNRPLPFNVSHLPTDPPTLAKTLCDTKKWSALPAANVMMTRYPIEGSKPSGCQLFGIVITLLQGPDVGSTPALRQALFKVLAGVPGVRLKGDTTDAAGKKGIELQLIDRVPAGSTKTTCVNGTPPDIGHRRTVVTHHPAMATMYTVIIDPSTATLLSLERSFSPFKIDLRSMVACIPAPGNQVEEQIPDRSVLISSGVVNSASAVSKGSVQECAVGSIPTFPWETCNGARNDGDKE
jgi:hypothetical protein